MIPAPGGPQEGRARTGATILRDDRPAAASGRTPFVIDPASLS